MNNLDHTILHVKNAIITLENYSNFSNEKEALKKIEENLTKNSSEENEDLGEYLHYAKEAKMTTQIHLFKLADDFIKLEEKLKDTNCRLNKLIHRVGDLENPRVDYSSKCVEAKTDETN